MGIPILNELSAELSRLYIAGSSLAKGDPRVIKFIAPLQKLGEKAPVFGALADRLSALTSGEEKDSPQHLMEVGMLLQSVLYTQGSSDPGDETRPMEYAARPLAMVRTPYSRLSEMISVLESGAQNHTDVFRLAKQAGQHDDPRLYAAYVDAVTDNKSYISNQVAEEILPSLGEEVVPFIRERLDLSGTGTKRHGRLLRVLYAIQGEGMLSLSEQALAEGSTPVVVEALYTLADNPKYEETLLGYAKDKKGEVRQAAFAALTKMGSVRGDKAILEALEKAAVGPLEDSLLATPNPAIAARVLAQAKTCMEDYKKNAAKLKVLLRVMAARDEGDALVWLEGILADAKLYAEAVNILELNQVLNTLCQSGTDAKNRLLLRVSEGDESRLYYKLMVCVRLFDAKEVYDRCHRDLKKGRNAYHLNQAYGIGYNEAVPDAQKRWDRRWAALFADAGNVNNAFLFIYDDDTHGWKRLLEATAELVKKRSYHNSYYGTILANAFRVGHPKSKKYFDKFVANGFPKENLVEIVNGVVPGAV